MTGERRKECQADSLESPSPGGGGKGYSNLVLDHGLAASGLDGRDAAFASALFYGVLERRITLDYQISHYSKMPLSQMAEPVKEILRLGFYQLLYMDKVPKAPRSTKASS